MFIDTHCHIEKAGAQEYIENALKENVIYLFNASEDLKTSNENVQIAECFSNVFACIGVHPENVDNFNNEDIHVFEIIIKNEKVKAIGEIGLDYHYGKENRGRQIEVFKMFLSLAERNNLPVVIHSRDAIEDTISILKNYKVKGVIHCFSGSVETAKEYIKLGFSLGIGGVLTFRNSKLHEVIENIPLEYIVLETDSPYLSPEPFRGRKNESKYIPIIAESVANYLNKSIEEIEEITTKNAIRIFDI